MELKPTVSPLKIVVVSLLLLLIGGAAGVSIAFFVAKPSAVVAVPEKVKNAITFPVYGPAELPNGFVLDTRSFAAQENNEIVAFSARDSTNRLITFTEQAKPKDFDFASFYANHMKNADSVSGTPFSSTLGKSKDETNYMLSVSTPETWMIVTANSSLGASEMQRIAKSIVRY